MELRLLQSVRHRTDRARDPLGSRFTVILARLVQRAGRAVPSCSVPEGTCAAAVAAMVIASLYARPYGPALPQSRLLSTGVPRGTPFMLATLRCRSRG